MSNPRVSTADQKPGPPRGHPSIVVRGIGAVSPAGWGMEPFRAALKSSIPIEPVSLERPGWSQSLSVRRVPPFASRPEFLSHARLRRTSPITQYGVAAALEALGTEQQSVSSGQMRLGIVYCVMSGCINYSRRFFAETLEDPITASPLVFPETVFNAPSSHLAALLQTTALNYTLIGDPGTFLQGLALAANWLSESRVEGCLVIGAEETDWLTSDAIRRFCRPIVLGAGAGAVFLTNRQGGGKVKLSKVTDPQLFLRTQPRGQAAHRMRSDLSNHVDAVLCDSAVGHCAYDRAESEAWQDWAGKRISPKTRLGEGLMAGAAWQTVAAIDAVDKVYESAMVSVVGCNQQAIGAEFTRITTEEN